MLVCLILATLVSVIVYRIFIKWKNFQMMWEHVKHIPGPKGVPILGNLPYIIKSLKDHTIREKRFEQCLMHKSIHKYYFFSYILVYVYNPEDLETILTDTELISKGYFYDNLQDWLGTGLLTSTGSKWHVRRKALTPAFHFSILQNFLNIFNKETDILVKNLMKQANKPIDIVKPVTEYTLASIGETSFGVSFNEGTKCEQYKKAIYDMVDVMVEKVYSPWINLPIIKHIHPVGVKSKKVIKVLHNFSKSIIKERKNELKETGFDFTNKKLALLDLLLKAKSEDHLDINDEGIREEVDTFMFEGHDTTAVALCYTLMVLAEQSKIQNEIYEEILDILGEKSHPNFKDLSNLTFMDRCIKEVLRLYPSVPNITRKLTKDVKTKDGYILPKGCDVNFGIIDLHRMPHIWENPEKFDPNRFLPENVSKRHPFAYLPFSAGPRNCIGQKFAVMEIKAALCGILRAFKLEPITKRSDLKYKLDMVLRPLNELNVKFTPRASQ